MITKAEPVLEIFRDRLPSHGFGSDNLQYGLRFFALKDLVNKALLQFNWKHSQSWLAFDKDSETAYLDVMENGPPPNIIAINPNNGHAHVYYGLRSPVHNYAHASKKALRYLAAVDLGLTFQLGADPGYAKLIGKNPLSNRWRVFFPRAELYDLEELAEWIPEEKFRLLKDLRRKLPREGLGRNCTLFEDLRLWAYRERRKPQGYLSQEFFYHACLTRAMAINETFNPPLPHSELRSTAKSISAWVWRNMSDQGFREWASRRGRASGRARAEKAAKLRERIVLTKEQCPSLTNADIGALCGCSERTVLKHLKQR